MTAIPLPTVAAERGGRPITGEAIALASLVGIALLQATLISQRSLNWDEFWHLRQVYMLHEGTLTSPLQTVLARLFGWVTALGLSQIDQVIVVRWVMFACELTAAVLVAGIAARFTDRTSGLLAAAAYLGGGFVFQHGFSFRTDPLVTALLMGSLWLVLCTRLRLPSILLCGFLAGSSAILTVKTVLYAPCFLGVIWLRWCETGRTKEIPARIAMIGVVALATLASIYLFHSTAMVTANSKAQEILGSSFDKMFTLGTSPHLRHAVNQILIAPFLSGAIAVTAGMLVWSTRSMPERIALAGLLAPVLTLLFYHNTAPYYYTFMLAPVAAATAVCLSAIRERFGTVLVAAPLAASALVLWQAEPNGRLDAQRQTIAAAEAIFGKPVGYFDFCGMIGNWPKHNTFMTKWGTERYLATGRPAMREAMLSETVPLLISNKLSLERLLEEGRNGDELHPLDAAALRSSYVHFWGSLWIAGKTIPAGSQRLEFELLVPGPYTVHGGEVELDGRRLSEGDVIELARGRHTAIANQQTEVRLIWGERLKVPSQESPRVPLWTRF